MKTIDDEMKTDDDNHKAQVKEIDQTSKEWKSTCRVRAVTMVFTILSLLPWAGLFFLFAFLFGFTELETSVIVNIVWVVYVFYPLSIVYCRARSSFYLDQGLYGKAKIWACAPLFYVLLFALLFALMDFLE